MHLLHDPLLQKKHCKSLGEKSFRISNCSGTQEPGVCGVSSKKTTRRPASGAILWEDPDHVISGLPRIDAVRYQALSRGTELGQECFLHKILLLAVFVKFTCYKKNTVNIRSCRKRYSNFLTKRCDDV